MWLLAAGITYTLDFVYMGSYYQIQDISNNS